MAKTIKRFAVTVSTNAIRSGWFSIVAFNVDVDGNVASDRGAHMHEGPGGIDAALAWLDASAPAYGWEIVRVNHRARVEGSDEPVWTRVRG